MIAHLTTEEIKAVTEIKEEVVRLTGGALRGIYLFGSKARGDHDEESDIDLAIVVKELNRKIKQEIIDIVVTAEVKYFVVISSLVLSEADFDLLLKRERRIALDIATEGIDLTLTLAKHGEEQQRL